MSKLAELILKRTQEKVKKQTGDVDAWIQRMHRGGSLEADAVPDKKPGMFERMLRGVGLKRKS